MNPNHYVPDTMPTEEARTFFNYWMRTILMHPDTPARELNLLCHVLANISVGEAENYAHLIEAVHGL